MTSVDWRSHKLKQYYLNSKILKKVFRMKLQTRSHNKTDLSKNITYMLITISLDKEVLCQFTIHLFRCALVSC